jgi:hypothetical protein
MLLQHQIYDYFRYVDDILIIYNTDIYKKLKQFNQIHTNLIFTMEQENDTLINFLDLSITRSDNGFSTSIYRKPTATDTLIHYNSCQPYEHKLAGINFLENRVITYPKSESNQMKEAVPWLRLLVAGLSPQRPGFAPRSIHVGFVVDRVALGQVFLQVLRFSPVNISFHRLSPNS